MGKEHWGDSLEPSLVPLEGWLHRQVHIACAVDSEGKFGDAPSPACPGVDENEGLWPVDSLSLCLHYRPLPNSPTPCAPLPMPLPVAATQMRPDMMEGSSLCIPGCSDS